MFSRLSLEIVNLYFKAFIMNLYSQSNAMIAMRRGEASYKVKKLMFLLCYYRKSRPGGKGGQAFREKVGQVP